MVREFLRKKLHVRRGGSVRIGELHKRYVRYVFWELPIEAHSQRLVNCRHESG